MRPETIFRPHKMKHITTIIFDLDGTLLDTLHDLAAAVNHALTSHSLPPRSEAEVRTFLGNGIRSLVERAVPDGLTGEQFEQVFETFRTYYMEHCQDRTQPYEGIMPLIRQLHERGLKMGIVSNKVDAAVQELNDRFFKTYIETAVGESPTVRRKPCPDAVLAALRRLGSSPKEAVYVGDSEVDLATAENAGLPCVSVLWGFRDHYFLLAHGATCCIERPEELPRTLGL